MRKLSLIILLIGSLVTQAQFRMLTFESIEALTNANPYSINGIVLLRTNSFDTFGRFYYFCPGCSNTLDFPVITAPSNNVGRWIEIGLLVPTATFTNVTNIVFGSNLSEDLGTNSTVDANWGNGFGLKRYGPVQTNATITFSNVPVGTNLDNIIQVDVQNPSTNNYTLTWPSSIDWGLSTSYTTISNQLTNTFVFQWNGSGLRGFTKTSGGSGTTINPTDNVIPVRTSTGAFGDSLFAQSGVTMTMTGFPFYITSTPVSSQISSFISLNNLNTNSGINDISGTGFEVVLADSSGSETAGSFIIQKSQGWNVIGNRKATAVLKLINGTGNFITALTVNNNRDVFVYRNVVWNGSTNTVFDAAGAGDPNGSITADIGSTYRRFDGGANTSFYVKESNNGGNTGWVGK